MKLVLRFYPLPSDVYKTWTGVHGPPQGPGPWTTPRTRSMDHSKDPVHGPPHRPPLIFNRKSPLLIRKFTGGQGMNKNTDSYLLLTSLRVCLVIAGCFGIAPHKWEHHKLVLRYRRSSAFLPPIFLTREAHAQHELSWVVDKCVTRSMGCKLYANEVHSQLTFKLLSIFN